MNSAQIIALACFGFFALGVLNYRIVFDGLRVVADYIAPKEES